VTDRSDLPGRYRALVVAGTNGPGPATRTVRELGPADLPAGDVLVRVEWSSVNFKDGLAATADGRVARVSPLVPGVDLAGTIVAAANTSADPRLAPGRPVLAHGYDIGTSVAGGFAEFARLPADWIVPLPDGLTPREAMAIGTAGFTAASAVLAIEERGLQPGDGPVVVTGASGGLGRTAVDILAARGHEVWAATGKPGEAERLRALGASRVIGREEVSGEGRPLESARWAAAIDTVGAPTLPALLRTLRIGGTVAACGNAGGATFSTTVYPFILRGVALLGMDSAAMAIGPRRALWARLATDLRPTHLGEDLTEVDLDGLLDALDAIVAGAARGRWIVRISG
jgi:acrylyl-CoA reductase (NADPH)